MPPNDERRPRREGGAQDAATSVEQSISAGADVSALLALSDERDLWTRRLAETWRAAYLLGYDDGRADQARDDDAAWAARPARIVRDRPTLAELELLRWGPGGREHFGDPRPSDRFGRQGAAA